MTLQFLVESPSLMRGEEVRISGGRWSTMKAIFSPSYLIKAPDWHQTSKRPWSSLTSIWEAYNNSTKSS